MSKFWYKVGTVRKTRKGLYRKSIYITVIFINLLREREAHPVYYIEGWHEIIDNTDVLVDEGRDTRSSTKLTLRIEPEYVQTAFDILKKRLPVKRGELDEFEEVLADMGILEMGIVFEDVEFEEDEEDE